MTTFAIVLNAPNPEVWSFVKDRWASHHIVSDTLAFISEADPSTLAASVAEEMGMNREKQVLGVVMPVSSYFGYNSLPLWEWLDKAS